MSFQVGDVIQHAIGVGRVEFIDDSDDLTLLVDFGSRESWVRQRECERCDPLRFSLDEQVNWDERRAWWRKLLPIYMGVSIPGFGCTPEILVSCFAAWDCELSPITTTPLTVEADCRAMYCWGLASIAIPDHAAHLYLLQHDGHDNCEFANTLLEVFTLAKLPPMTASVSPCEVTL